MTVMKKIHIENLSLTMQKNRNAEDPDGAMVNFE